MSGLRKTINRLARGDKPTANSRWVTTRGTSVWDEAAQRYVSGESEGYWYDGDWALAHDVAPVWEAEDFQFFNNDGNITTATSIAAENVAVAKVDGIAPGTAVQLKVNVGETAGAAGTGLHTGGWVLQFSKNSGAWTPVGATTDCKYSNSIYLTNGTAVAAANYDLTWGSSGTQRDWGDECEDGVSVQTNEWSSDYCEICFSIRFDATGSAEDDVFTFRVLAPDLTSAVTFTNVPTITLAAPPPSTEQTAFRFVNDNGNESGSTFAAALNTDFTGSRDTQYRCRIQISNPGTPAETGDTFKPQKSINGGAWTDLLDTDTDVRSVLSSGYTDNTVTTERLAGSQTFQAGEMLEGATPVTGSIALGAFSDSEIEFAFDCTGLLGSDYVDFRLVRVTGGALDAVWQTPRFTVASSAAQTVLHTSFPSPTSDLLGLSGETQRFRLWVRRDAQNDGVGTPTIDLSLYENGSLVTAISTGTSITSNSGQLIEGLWDPDDLALISGINVELRAVGQVGGTGINARTVEFGAVEWCVEHALASGIPTGSGSPSITKPTSSGTSKVGRSSDGSPSITKPTSSGSATRELLSDGSPSVSKATASGASEIVKSSDGSPSIAPIESTGVSEVKRTAVGSPSIIKPTSSGTSKVGRSSDGSPSITPIESAGVSEVKRTADGSPSITPIESTGVSEVKRTADGSPSITKPTSSGTGKVGRSSDGSPSISPITADGVSEVIREATGSPSISSITAEGVSEILREATGSPSISPITAEGVSEIIRDASGGPSISPITAAGNSFIWPKVYLNTTETLVGATEMTISSVDIDGTSITFDDSVGTPVGALFLGVENRTNGDVGWIAVTVTESTGPTVVFGGLGA